MSTSISKSPAYLILLGKSILNVSASFWNHILPIFKIAKAKWRLGNGAFVKEKITVLLLLALVLTCIIGGSSTFGQTQSSKHGSSSVISNSRQPGAGATGGVRGIIADGVTKHPLALVTISIEDKSTGKTVNVTDSDVNGKFLLDGLAAGLYRLFITDPNYGTTIIDGLAVDKGEINMGNIRLVSDAEGLTKVPVDCGKD